MILLLSAIPCNANTVITFEGLPDLTPITTQYPGVTFTNATILTAGISLNEFEFPPFSGTNVVFDDGGSMTISFLAPIFRFSGFFTYLAPLTLSAYDQNNNLLGSINSLFNNNLALSGDPGSNPNEQLTLSASGIKSITINGDPAGGSFTLDNATITPVPEPSSILLLLLTCTCFVVRRKVSNTQKPRGAR